jgi:hypothetical protein
MSKSKKRLRRYGNKDDVIAWIQYKCSICGRFLKKTQRKNCSNCQSNYHRKIVREYDMKYKKELKIKRDIRRNLSGHW